MIWNIIFVVLVCLVIICLWCMIYDSNRFVTVAYEIHSAKLKRDCKILFLSDLHNKEYGKENRNLLDAIQKVQPDLILVGGDMMNASPGADFENAVRFLKKISETYPVYYALGNHEYRSRIYPENYGDMYERYMEALKDTGIVFLDNQSTYCEDYSIRLTGLTMDRKYYKRFVKRKMEPGYIQETIGDASESTFQILLAHNPEFFADYAAWKPDLVLSGHVHGGVVKVPFLGGLIAPSLKPFPHYDGGIFHEFGSTMVLSRGLGMHTIPVRLFNPGELVVVSLKTASEDKKEH